MSKGLDIKTYEWLLQEFERLVETRNAEVATQLHGILDDQQALKQIISNSEAIDSTESLYEWIARAVQQAIVDNASEELSPEETHRSTFMELHGEESIMGYFWENEKHDDYFSKLLNLLQEIMRAEWKDVNVMWQSSVLNKEQTEESTLPTWVVLHRERILIPSKQKDIISGLAIHHFPEENYYKLFLEINDGEKIVQQVIVVSWSLLDWSFDVQRMEDIQWNEIDRKAIEELLFPPKLQALATTLVTMNDELIEERNILEWERVPLEGQERLDNSEKEHVQQATKYFADFLWSTVFLDDETAIWPLVAGPSTSWIQKVKKYPVDAWVSDTIEENEEGDFVWYFHPAWDNKRNLKIVYSTWHAYLTENKKTRYLPKFALLGHGESVDKVPKQEPQQVPDGEKEEQEAIETTHEVSFSSEEIREFVVQKQVVTYLAQKISKEGSWTPKFQRIESYLQHMIWHDECVDRLETAFSNALPHTDIPVWTEQIQVVFQLMLNEQKESYVLWRQHLIEQDLWEVCNKIDEVFDEDHEKEGVRPKPPGSVSSQVIFNANEEGEASFSWLSQFLEVAQEQPFDYATIHSDEANLSITQDVKKMKFLNDQDKELRPQPVFNKDYVLTPTPAWLKVEIKDTEKFPKKFYLSFIIDGTAEAAVDPYGVFAWTRKYPCTWELELAWLDEHVWRRIVNQEMTLEVCNKLKSEAVFLPVLKAINEKLPADKRNNMSHLLDIRAYLTDASHLPPGVDANSYIHFVRLFLLGEAKEYNDKEKFIDRIKEVLAKPSDIVNEWLIKKIEADFDAHHSLTWLWVHSYLSNEHLESDADGFYYWFDMNATYPQWQNAKGQWKTSIASNSYHPHNAILFGKEFEIPAHTIDSSIMSYEDVTLKLQSDRWVNAFALNLSMKYKGKIMSVQLKWNIKSIRQQIMKLQLPNQESPDQTLPFYVAYDFERLLFQKLQQTMGTVIVTWKVWGQDGTYMLTDDKKLWLCVYRIEPNWSITLMDDMYYDMIENENGEKKNLYLKTVWNLIDVAQVNKRNAMTATPISSQSYANQLAVKTKHWKKARQDITSWSYPYLAMMEVKALSDNDKSQVEDKSMRGRLKKLITWDLTEKTRMPRITKKYGDYEVKMLPLWAKELNQNMKWPADELRKAVVAVKHVPSWTTKLFTDMYSMCATDFAYQDMQLVVPQFHADLLQEMVSNHWSFRQWEVYAVQDENTRVVYGIVNGADGKLQYWILPSNVFVAPNGTTHISSDQLTHDDNVKTKVCGNPKLRNTFFVLANATTIENDADRQYRKNANVATSSSRLDGLQKVIDGIGDLWDNINKQLK